MNQELITALYLIGQSLNQGVDLIEALGQALGTFCNFLSAAQGVIRILNPLRNEAHIEVFHGSWENFMEGQIQAAGEKTSNRVIDTGQPIVIPRIGLDPLFSNRPALMKPSG